MGNRVDLADVREELVAETFALGCTCNEPRNVDELDRGRHDLLRPRNRGELLEPRVGHCDDADVWIDRAKRIVFRCDLRARERIEQRRLADVRQSDDSALNWHSLAPTYPAASASPAPALLRPPDPTPAPLPPPGPLPVSRPLPPPVPPAPRTQRGSAAGSSQPARPAPASPESHPQPRRSSPQ